MDPGQLHVAAAKGMEWAAAVLAAGANINSQQTLPSSRHVLPDGNRNRFSPAFFAADVATLKLLLDNGADIGAKDRAVRGTHLQSCCVCS